jgi:hypothetical protein
MSHYHCVSCPFSSLWGQHDNCSSLLVASRGYQGHCLAAMVTYQQGVLVVGEAVVPVRVCAWDPSVGRRGGCCNHRIGVRTEAQTSIVMDGDAVAKARLKEQRKGATPPSLRPTSMAAPCTSSAAGGAQEEESAQKKLEDQL